MLQLMHRLSCNADDDEISQFISSYNMKRSSSRHQTSLTPAEAAGAEAANAEAEIQGEELLSLALKSEAEDALEVAALRRGMKVSMLREFEELLGPILQWRHRTWPEDASYTFVSSTMLEKVCIRRNVELWLERNG